MSYIGHRTELLDENGPRSDRFHQPMKPDKVFKNFLKSEHRQFLEKYINNNDAFHTMCDVYFKCKYRLNVLRTCRRGFLVALVDEPFALEAAFNFFNDYGSLPKEILSTMSKVNNASSCGFLWETYLTTEFEKKFDGSTNIRNMPMFVGINDFPDTFVGSPKIVRSPVKRVANSTTGYKLDKFFSEKPELHPTFYFLDFFCGPDLIFFVQFENQIVVPVFAQLKLHYSVKISKNVLNGLHPTMFYKRKDGKITNEKSNRSTIQKVIELC
ncbi:16807_t:CDS:2 [Rhizophagus irregularis]|nr:16807_t:CDS:2 [Rhizophagus irregularis]